MGKHEAGAAHLRRVVGMVAATATIMLLLAACALARGGERGNPLPTPRPTEVVGPEARSAAKDTPQGTWEGYLRDMIAYQVNDLEARTALYQRYENPDHTAQNMGGRIKDVVLLEDRTEWTVRPTSAYSLVDFDVRVIYLDGDTETRHCRFEVFLQKDEEDGMWYVINPRGLDVQGMCSR